jgi:hypothetical protein
MKKPPTTQAHAAPFAVSVKCDLKSCNEYKPHEMGRAKRVHLWRGCITGFGGGQSAKLVETDDDAERNNQRSKELE